MGEDSLQDFGSISKFFLALSPGSGATLLALEASPYPLLAARPWASYLLESLYFSSSLIK